MSLTEWMFALGPALFVLMIVAIVLIHRHEDRLEEQERRARLADLSNRELQDAIQYARKRRERAQIADDALAIRKWTIRELELAIEKEGRNWLPLDIDANAG